MLTDVCSSKFVEPAKPAVYEFQSDTVLRAQPKQQHRPSPIEDYEPGRCSLAVSNGVEVRFSPCRGAQSLHVANKQLLMLKIKNSVNVFGNGWGRDTFD